jgi:hypothetical protein
LTVSEPRFTLVCLPGVALVCAICGRGVETVHVEADGKHYCLDAVKGCAGDRDIGSFADLADTMNALDRVLFSTDPLNRGVVLEMVERFVRDIGRHHCPEGIGHPGDGVTFAELLDRAEW